MKPGSAGPGVPGIYPVIFDENGEVLPAGAGKAGNICIRNPWPGIMQTIWGDRDRFVSQYYRKYCKDPKSKDWHDWPYFAGDGAVLRRRRLFPDSRTRRRRHQRGRPPAGHQGTRVGLPDGSRSRGSGGRAGGGRDQGPRAGDLHLAQARSYSVEQEVTDKVIKTIETMIGKIARPKSVHIVPDMPKTRSGKLMRRILAAISNTMDDGDITTLANPDVVEQIRVQVQGEQKVAAKKVPRM